MIRAVVFDLDGVVRHFDVEQVRDVERRHDVQPGSVFAAAFSRPLLDRVVTGEITRAEWVHQVGERIGAPEAANEWASQLPVVDHDVLHLVDEIRRAGIVTAVLTNGTDTIPAELRESGIDEHFDRIYNSAEVGFAKPDVRAFQHVLDDLNVVGADVFFTDDSAAKLVGAGTLTMTTHLYEDMQGLRVALRGAGLPIA